MFWAAHSKLCISTVSELPLHTHFLLFSQQKFLRGKKKQFCLFGDGWRKLLLSISAVLLARLVDAVSFVGAGKKECCVTLVQVWGLLASGLCWAVGHIRGLRVHCLCRCLL